MTDNKDEKENLFKGRFNKKNRLDGTTDWNHDPSGEELKIIYEDDKELSEDNKNDTLK